MLAVLALYRIDPDAFTRADLRVLLAMGSKAGMAVERALQGRSVDRAVQATLASAAQAGAD